MTSEWTNRFLSTAEFFALAKARLTQYAGSVRHAGAPPDAAA
jgi:hypothetical protein